MSELPEGWTTARVEEIAEVRLGRQRSPDKAFGPHMRPYLRAANVTWAGLDLADVKEMNFDPHELPAYVLKKGDILLAEASGSPGEVGKPAVFNGEIANCCFQNTLIRVRADDGLSPFLRQRFSYDALSGAFAQASQGLGIHHLGAETIARWEVDLPPLKEQRRIVDKVEDLLSRSRKAKRSLNEIQALLEDYRRSVLVASFRGDLTAEWREKNPDVEPPAELLAKTRLQRRQRWETAELEKMHARGKIPDDDTWKDKYEEPASVDTEGLAELPEGWTWISLDHVLAAIETGSSFACEERPPRDDEVGVVKVSAVTWGQFDEEESKTCVDPSRVDPSNFIGEGDFLFSRANTLNLVGACVIVGRISKRLMLSDKILRFRFVDLDQGWVLAVLRSPWARLEIERLATGNQHSMKNIGQERIRSIRVPLPPREEQSEIVRIVDCLLGQNAAVANALHEQISELDTIDLAVLARAFRGELVPQDRTDESASVLVESIRAERAESAAKPSVVHPNAPVKRPAMSSQDMKDRVRTAIQDQPFDRFSFDDLRAKVPGDYEALKESLFHLLEHEPHVVCQVFDKKVKAMRLQRVKP